MRKYILEGKEIKDVTLLEWSEFFEKSDFRQVCYTQIDDNVGVSTVFIGLDMNYRGVGPPLLFETMIFGGANDEFTETYPTWQEAEKGHKRAVNLCNQ